MKYSRLMLLALVLTGVSAQADLFSDYAPSGNTFTVPSSAYSVSNGLIHYFDDGTLYRQNALNSGSFTAVGHFSSGFSVNDFPAFVEFSPDGSRIAIGNSGGADFGTYQVAVFDAALLDGSNPDLSAGSSIYGVNHNAAVWANNQHLLITAGVFGQPSGVTLLDTLSTPGSPSNTTVVANIGGASAGIALTECGLIFTGNGFNGIGPSDTGWIKAISPDAWINNSPADFEEGPGSTFVADLLSAGSLRFDSQFNLLVGGGDFGGSGDLNYFALISGTALHELLVNGTAININDPSQVRKFDPSAGAGSFYSLAVDLQNNCFYALDGSTAYQFCAVPEPTTWVMLLVGGMLMAWRVRRARVPALIAAILFVGSASSHASNFFAEEVVNYSPGAGVTEGSGFGITSRVLGGPRGGGTNQATTDVLSLGESGSVTLGFNSKWIENGSGFDFIVFENPLVVGNPDTVYGELFFVEVSTDGTNFARFDTLSLNPGPIQPFGTMNPNLVSGFGGTGPGLANVDTNSIDPFDPTVAGGNAFDLSALAGHSLVQSGAVNLNLIRYLRLVDVKGDGVLVDSSGNPIYDPTGFSQSADLDAVSVIHGIPEPSTISLFSAALVIGALLARRRK